MCCCSSACANALPPAALPGAPRGHAPGCRVPPPRLRGVPPPAPVSPRLLGRRGALCRGRVPAASRQGALAEGPGRWQSAAWRAGAGSPAVPLPGGFPRSPGVTAIAPGLCRVHPSCARRVTDSSGRFQALIVRGAPFLGKHR